MAVKKTKTKTDELVEKMEKKKEAENLLELVEEYKQDTERKTLQRLASAPAGDLMELQSSYRAILCFEGWLKDRISEGARAGKKLGEGEI